VDTLWTFLKGRALSVSRASDVFTFEVSWLGVIIIVAELLLIRYLRR
jgi:hypothetical protein